MKKILIFLFFSLILNSCGIKYSKMISGSAILFSQVNNITLGMNFNEVRDHIEEVPNADFLIRHDDKFFRVWRFEIIMNRQVDQSTTTSTTTTPTGSYETTDTKTTITYSIKPFYFIFNDNHELYQFGFIDDFRKDKDLSLNELGNKIHKKYRENTEIIKEIEGNAIVF
jgi:hypothetical protein